MTELVERDKGAPVFGRGTIQGWDLQPRSPEHRERTLRNALLAALHAEHHGDTDLSYEILTHRLSTGETIWQAVAAALPHHVAQLSGAQAGYTLTIAQVRAEVDRRTVELGRNPTSTDRDGTLTWVWQLEGKPAWYSVDQGRCGRFRLRATLPAWGTLDGRMGIDCLADHADIPGQPDPHGQEECLAPTMADILGEDLPATFSAVQELGLSEPEEAALEARIERRAIQSAEGQLEALPGEMMTPEDWF